MTLQPTRTSNRTGQDQYIYMGTGSLGPRARLGPGHIWAQGPLLFGPRAHWVQGPFGPRVCLDPGPIGPRARPWAHGCCPMGPLYGMGPWYSGPIIPLCGPIIPVCWPKACQPQANPAGQVKTSLFKCGSFREHKIRRCVHH